MKNGLLLGVLACLVIVFGGCPSADQSQLQAGASATDNSAGLGADSSGLADPSARTVSIAGAASTTVIESSTDTIAVTADPRLGRGTPPKASLPNADSGVGTPPSETPLEPPPPPPPPPPAGACCYPDYTCAVTTNANCTGTWLGANVWCTQCPPPPPTGACCYPDYTCAMTTEAACSGSWLGANMPCTRCPPPPPPPDVLPEPNSIEASIDFVARRFVAAASVFSVFGDLGDARLSLEPNTMVTWGTCPQVLIASGPTDSLIGFEFGTGCAAACAGGDTVIGANGEIYRSDDLPAWVYVANGFTVDGRVITPYLVQSDVNTLPNIMNADMNFVTDGVTLDGPCDFGVAGIGRSTGNLTVHIGREYVLKFTAADLSLSSARVSNNIVANTVIRPALYGNMLPDTGTISFTFTWDGSSDDVVIRFSAKTQSDRTVSLTIDGLGPFTYKLADDIR